MDQVQIAAISKAIGPLAIKNDLQIVYLFGSQAWADAGPNSDWDIGVFKLGGFESSLGGIVKRLELGEEIACVVKETLGLPQLPKVDVVDLFKSPLQLKFEVIRPGVPLYARDEEFRIKWEVDISRRFYESVLINERLEKVARLTEEGR